jgi:fatty acyl-CoA reductase
MSTLLGSSDYVPVGQFYHDRSVFVTGGTGFMGKVLVEKLLRSCPGIKNIYLLMRPKRGQDVNTRLCELLNAPVSFVYSMQW